MPVENSNVLSSFHFKLYILQTTRSFSWFFARKITTPSFSFPPFEARQPLLFSCRSEFICNQRATDKRPILITLSFAYLHINDCRLCCFSAAAVPLPSALLKLSLPTCCNTMPFSELLAPHFQTEVDRHSWENISLVIHMEETDESLCF